MWQTMHCLTESSAWKRADGMARLTMCRWWDSTSSARYFPESQKRPRSAGCVGSRSSRKSRTRQQPLERIISGMIRSFLASDITRIARRVVAFLPGSFGCAPNHRVVPKHRCHRRGRSMCRRGGGACGIFIAAKVLPIRLFFSPAVRIPSARCPVATFPSVKRVRLEQNTTTFRAGFFALVGDWNVLINLWLAVAIVAVPPNARIFPTAPIVVECPAPHKSGCRVIMAVGNPARVFATSGASWLRKFFCRDKQISGIHKSVKRIPPTLSSISRYIWAPDPRFRKIAIARLYCAFCFGCCIFEEFAAFRPLRPRRCIFCPPSRASVPPSCTVFVDAGRLRPAVMVSSGIRADFSALQRRP